jgi:UDP-glucose:(heptosyl)LPS alpha-1,3-glucosyltransferase
MRIALCHENVLPERGGAEMYVADLARRLVAAGHEVHLYACRWSEVHLPNQLHFHSIEPPHGSRFLRPWRFSAAIRQALERDRPQVSLGFDKTIGTDIYYPLGGLQPASARQNIRKHRWAIQRLGARLTKSFDPVQWSYSALERRALTGDNPPLLIVNSEMVRNHAQHYYGFEPARIRVIHNAIDPGRFDDRQRARLRAAQRRECGFGPTDVVAAFVAMNYHLKGLEPLLRAMALVPTFQPMKLLVAGHAQTQHWQRLARHLGVERRVSFIGPCSDVRRVYFAADLHVHPTFYDPCSGVVLEALACGLPVITSRFNGAAELVPPAAGIVVNDPHDHEKLASYLVEFMDPVRRDDAARAARAASQSWTLDHHYAKWLQVFEEAAESRRAA